jgi:inosine/xanthosine triphosphatase
MQIAIGSQNPVKIAAVETIIRRVWPDAVLTAVSPPTGVSQMPLSDDEMITGARNRAIAARALTTADLGIGLEGGTHPQSFGLVLTGWVVITDGNGREGLGSAGRLLVPSFIAQRILAGEELGPVMDGVMNETHIAQKGGAVGAFTSGLFLRQDAFETAIIYALAPFVTPSLYDKSQV